DAEPAVAQIDLIEICLENLILGVMLLHLARRGLLAELARETEITPVDDVRMHIADELLRDGARPTATLPKEPSLDRARDADEIDAVVLIEALVLDSDERVLEVTWQRAASDARAELMTDLAYQ